MKSHDVLKKAADSGVALYLDGGTLKARGSREAVETLSPELRIHKAEIVELLASAQMMAANDPLPEPPADPNAWRELAAAYHLHHFKCSACIAAGRGAQYGLRCGTGAALWTSYQNN